ncbi:MAG: prepilin peptidase [Bacillota bacterium]|nr:prepilin peptidase [Bacillota bacterium]MDW7683952.1 prepilin peptidase [Bacillota bacterium]
MLIVWILFVFVAICFYTDLTERKIYNAVVLSGLVAALILNTMQQGLYLGVTLTMSGFLTGISLLIIPFILGGLGAGDVKMLGMIGAFVGHNLVLQVLIVSAIAGGLFALVSMLRQGMATKRLKTFFIGVGCFVATRKTVHLNNLDDADAEKYAIPYGVALTTGVIIIYIMGSMNYLMPGVSAAGF